MQNAIDKIQKIINDNKVVLFMKGTKNMPQCGFSANVAHILKQLDADFFDINVLQDQEIRDAIKVFSDWPTIPQLYINKEFIGGCDIVKEMYASGELLQLLAY
jgi:monothiol glutaredoxin